MHALKNQPDRQSRSCIRLRSVGEVVLVGVVAAVDLWAWDGDNGLRGGQSLPIWAVPIATALLYPVLLLRWRYPRAVFALHWMYSLSGLMMPWYAPVGGLFVSLYPLARRESPRIALGVLVLCAVPIVVNGYNNAALAVEGRYAVNFIGHALLWSVLTLTVWSFGRMAYAAEQRAEKEKQEQAAAAVRAERLHLARELHDIVSHSVSAMILQAAGARTLLSRDEEQMRVTLESIESTGVQAMGELHRLLGLLRAAGAEKEHSSTTTTASLQDLDTLVNSVRATGVEVEVVSEGHPTELDRSVGLAAYRIVQESLTNTIKHAGRGAFARIHLRWEPKGLTLTIRDRAGFQATQTAELSSGHGLAGLTERVNLVGGTLEVGPIADGFLVRAHLPTRLTAISRTTPDASAQEAS